MDPHFLDLINREIDGETSAAESDELRSIVAANPELKQQLDTMREIVLEVEAIPAVESPAGLRDEILASIRARQERTRRSEEHVVQLASFRRAPLIRYALAIAAGFIFGFVLYPFVAGLGQGSRFNTRDVSGTMAPLASPLAGRSSNAIAVDGIPATVTASSTAAAVAIEIDLAGTGASSLVVTWNPDRFALESFERRSGVATVAIGASRAEFQALGASKLALRLRRLQPGNAPVHLEPNASGNGVAVVESR